MIKGVLLKGYSGFYYVYAEDRVWECSLRGRFRIKGQEFIPGDWVVILPEGENKATIEKVERRRNALSRPVVANVDQAILVFALTSPKPDRNLLDRLLIQVTEAEIEPIIVFTKLDKYKADVLTNDTEAHSISNDYRNIGYTVFEVSNKTGEGIEDFGSRLSKKISVLAGPSGVGKSSLFNALSPGKNLKIGDLSVKSKRGRHTTRHVELMVCSGGLVADTPGFSALAMPSMNRTDLSDYFPEFAARRGQCRFSSCLHDKEPNCAIKAALEKGEIYSNRYEHYLIFLKEVMEAERKY